MTIVQEEDGTIIRAGLPSAYYKALEAYFKSPNALGAPKNNHKRGHEVELITSPSEEVK